MPESNLDTVARLEHNLGLEGGLAAVNFLHEALDPLEPLKQPREHVAHFREGKLLPDADAGPAVEGHVLPGLGLPVEPAVGAVLEVVGKLFAGRGVKGGVALHDEGAVADGGVLEDGDGQGAVRAAAARERRVAEGQAHVEGHHGVQAQGLVHDVLQVLHVLEVVVRGLALEADLADDLVAQLAHALGVPAELVNGPRQRRGRRVAARQEHGDELVADHLAVPGEECELVQECVSRLGLGLGGKLLRTELEGTINVRLTKLVDDLETGAEGLEWYP